MYLKQIYGLINVFLNYYPHKQIKQSIFSEMFNKIKSLYDVSFLLLKPLQDVIIKFYKPEENYHVTVHYFAAKKDL